MNDLDLIRASRQGDRSAFEALARLWARPIYAFLLPHVRDVQLAEDLTQETLLRAWKSIRTLADASKFKGWLFAIAQRQMIDDSRSRRLPFRTVELDARPARPASLDPRQDEVLDALTRLPESYRTALSLRFLSGLSPTQIQERLGISNGSLRGILHRGLQMLRDELDLSSQTDKPHEARHDTRQP